MCPLYGFVNEKGLSGMLVVREGSLRVHSLVGPGMVPCRIFWLPQSPMLGSTSSLMNQQRQYLSDLRCCEVSNILCDLCFGMSDLAKIHDSEVHVARLKSVVCCADSANDSNRGVRTALTRPRYLYRAPSTTAPRTAHPELVLRTSSDMLLFISPVEAPPKIPHTDGLEPLPLA